MTAPTASFPEQLVKATVEHDGVRYIEIGDDGAWLVMLGHPEVRQVVQLIEHVGYDLDAVGIDEEKAAKLLDYTWARLLLACPDHDKETDGCEFCEAKVSPEAWWVDWDKGDDKQDAPGWFPVVVWETGA